MQLHFCTAFDGAIWSGAPQAEAGVLYAGPQKLLSWLETRLGLNGYPDNTNYLRIELYRQALQQHLDACAAQPLFAAEPFYARSFHTDRFACAAVLLQWRDELLLSGWNFTATSDIPPRLRDLSAAEDIFLKKIQSPETGAEAVGFADRFEQVLQALDTTDSGFNQIHLYEPRELQAPFLRRLLHLLENRGVGILDTPPAPAAPADTNLGWLQRRMAGLENTRKNNTDDGSLLVLHTRRDSDAAVYLAQIIAQNPDFQPLLLIPELNRSVEQSLELEAQPPMGILSASLARPSLQVLKLAPAFLWEPVDVFKIMEFVTLPLKPFDDGLALEIARVMAQKPGLFSDTWFAAVYSYLERPELGKEAQKQYDFWFERRRYPLDGAAPKRDVIQVYQFLHNWAQKAYADNKNSTLLVLAEQARRICELLEALPEQRLGFLELERIVRTIYEPAPVQLSAAEKHALPYVHQTGAVASRVDNLVWWNCLFEDMSPKPDKWRSEERDWLSEQAVFPETPAQQSRRNLLLQQRALIQTQKRLLLWIPAQADGAEAVPSLLKGDIEAAFTDAGCFTFQLDDPAERAAMLRHFTLPGGIRLDTRTPGRNRPHLQLRHPEWIAPSEYETPTNLDALLYYPHRWFFRQKLKLYPPSLLSVTGDKTLLGSLAHRFFELLLQDDFMALDKKAVYAWVDAHAQELLEREGATLLLYGREPERNAFLNRVKNAAWNLISQIKSNSWQVEGTEMALEGSLAGMPVRGKADLVLRRGNERCIVDLKWSGARRRREMIMNGEDLQLVLYAKLLPPESEWAHTAYFILEDAKMIARNRAAFADAIVAGQGDDHVAACERIFERMEKTYLWRMEQIRSGAIELRNARTAPELDALYADQLIDLLEMRSDDARYDEYGGMLNVQ